MGVGVECTPKYRYDTPNVSKWVRLLLDILNTALASQHLLPARTAAELATQLQAAEAEGDPEAPPFFAMMEPNDQ